MIKNYLHLCKVLNNNAFKHIYKRTYSTTASACFLKKSSVNIIYLGFDLDKSKKEYYFQSLKNISGILGNRISFHLVCFDLVKKGMQIELEKKWNSGERNLSKEVLEGIKEDELMTFSLSSVNKF